MNHLADLCAISYWPDSIAEYKRQGYHAWALHMPSAIDEAYALIKNQNIIVVIRGTDEPQDWLKRNIELMPSRSKTMGIDLHRPLWEGCKTIIPAIESILQTVKPGSLTITGHSKGGAMAHLCGYHFRLHSPSVVSFGAPRCLSRDFPCELRNHYRVVHHADPVPRVPPRLAGWEHFGKSWVIGTDGKIDDRPTAWINAIAAVGPFEFVKDNFSGLINNHFSYSNLSWS